MPVEPPTTALYYLLNKALREKNRDNIKPFVKILWLLMQALKKAPPCPHPVVYRGVKEDLSRQFIMKGQKITWPGFSSTTSSLDVLSQDIFLGTKTMFHIELTSGRARMISALSMNRSDKDEDHEMRDTPPIECIRELVMVFRQGCSDVSVDMNLF
eukprot:gene61457-biopygen2988